MGLIGSPGSGQDSDLFVRIKLCDGVNKSVVGVFAAKPSTFGRCNNNIRLVTNLQLILYYDL
jgi:hypothetical protein